MSNVKRPALEGTVAVRDDRRLSFAEYGSRAGPRSCGCTERPGARRQIPLEARAYAEQHGLRIIGIDRPGIGSSTPHLYPNVLDWTRRPRDPARHPGDRHGPADRPVGRRPLRAGRRRGAARPGARGRGARRRRARPGARTRVDGGVDPARGPARAAAVARAGAARGRADRCHPAGAAAGRARASTCTPPCSRPATRTCSSRPEFKAMFLDDLLNGSRFQTSAPLNDLVLFTRRLGLHGRRRDGAGALVARRRRPHRAVRARSAHGRPAARRHAEGDRRGEPPRRARHRPGGARHADGARPAARPPARPRTRPRNPITGVQAPHGPQWWPQLHTCHFDAHDHHRRRDRWGRRISTPEMKEVTVTARTATAPARRGASSTSTPRRPRCARTSSGPSAAYSALPVNLDWTPQPAQSGHLPRRAVLDRAGRVRGGDRLRAARLEPPAVRDHRGADGRRPRAPATPTRPTSASSTP